MEKELRARLPADRALELQPLKTNIFFVSLHTGSGGIAILRPPGAAPMTKGRALNLAAWLVALADPTRARFDELLAAVLRT
jgi:hypothetical protein